MVTKYHPATIHRDARDTDNAPNRIRLYSDTVEGTTPSAEPSHPECPLNEPTSGPISVTECSLDDLLVEELVEQEDDLADEEERHSNHEAEAGTEDTAPGTRRSQEYEAPDRQKGLSLPESTEYDTDAVHFEPEESDVFEMAHTTAPTMKSSLLNDCIACLSGVIDASREKLAPTKADPGISWAAFPSDTVSGSEDAHEQTRAAGRVPDAPDSNQSASCKPASDKPFSRKPISGKPIMEVPDYVEPHPRRMARSGQICNLSDRNDGVRGMLRSSPTDISDSLKSPSPKSSLRESASHHQPKAYHLAKTPDVGIPKAFDTLDGIPCATVSPLDSSMGPDELVFDDSYEPLRPIEPTVASVASSSTRYRQNSGLVDDLRDRYAIGDFASALDTANALLERSPGDAEATSLRSICTEELTRIYTKRLGSLNSTPKLAVSPSELQAQGIDHRTGFVLSCIDGRSTIEELLDVSGMSSIDTLRVLCMLLQRGIIEVVKR